MSECGVTGCGIPDNHGHGSSSGVTVECSVCAILRADVARLRRERDAALVHGPEDMVRALEEVRAEVERLRARLVFLNGEAARRWRAYGEGEK